MMNDQLAPAGSSHLADSVLVQLLDGEATSSSANAHLTDCAHCTERFSALQRAADLFSASLPDVRIPDLSPNRTRAGRRRLIPVAIAAAATIVIIGSAAAATPLLRHWIMRNAPQSSARVENSAADLPSTSASRGTGIVAAFVPTDTVLVIRVEQAQSTGVVELVRVSGEKASAQIIGRTDAEDILVLPSAIRVANASTSTADYRISVPTFVRLVRVMVAGKETAVVRNDGRLDRRILLR